MDEIAHVTMSGSVGPSILHGPVPAILTLTNVSGSPVRVLLPYPDPNNLRFECISPGFAVPKPVERQEIERTVPIFLNPGEKFVATYFLNRYLGFLKAGEPTIVYNLQTTITTDPTGQEARHQDVTFQDEFTVRLVEVTEAELRAQLTEYAAQLRSTDRQRKMEAAEALAFLDTPLSVEYVAPMLSIDNLEIVGIRALGQHPSEKSAALLVGMLSHRDSAVVAATLTEIDHLRIPIERRRVQELLRSDNANIRWIALEWLAAHPDAQDLQLVLPLNHDHNQVVRERASSYAANLQQR